jgi:hypothetical protein
VGQLQRSARVTVSDSDFTSRRTPSSSALSEEYLEILAKAIPTESNLFARFNALPAQTYEY